MDVLIVVLQAATVVLVLAVGGYAVALLRRRSSDGAAAELRDRVERLAGQFAESLRASSVDMQDRIGRSSAELKDALATNLAQGRKESAETLQRTTRALEERFERLQKSNEERLGRLQDDNSKKLDQMRAVVEEKLQTTLEARLGQSFRQVSERLEQVHKGLGEMQALAGGVGDLKKVLTNVKTRGTWGEVQLGNLLEQVLTAEQYASNVATRPGSNDRVEYAIRLPGRDEHRDETVWLPIDAKFPTEDYQRLIEAQEAADAVAAEAAGRQLQARIEKSARDIRDKYVAPPHTTDFAVMFLPTEGLYAEVVRRPGLLETLQRECRVVVSGPTTLAALLNSLQMGFRTLAIEQRSSEVWKLLGAVKGEFGKFGEVLDRVHKQLETASRSIDTAARKTRTIERKLRKVEELPADESAGLLGPVEEDGILDGDEAVAGEAGDGAAGER
ncbi:MAG TPA: DNA recombination protein RmuC [Phycisphaerae bacterium]|nr:DNA recombination protein RmuC [Phycisphaerae bacterium]HOI54344.1 DNA recombination protein RmuC [Phycisphaerae bacterium]